MKLSTIWTIPAMTTMERLRRTRELGFRKIAAHLPAKIKYYTTMQQLANVSVKLSDQEIPSIKMDDILKNLDTPKGLD